MTTLPQTTTTVRLPRPASGLGPPIAGAIAALPASPAMTGADVWRVLRGNIWLILTFLVISAAAGYGIYEWLSIHFPRYTASALLEIDPKRSIDPTLQTATETTPTDQLATEQNSQVAMLLNGSLLSQVINKPDGKLRKTQTFNLFNLNVPAFREYFDDNFAVTAMPNTNLIKIQFTCANQQDAQVIVQEIGDTHVANQQAITATNLQTASNDLNAKRDKLQSKWQETKAKRDTLLGELAVDQGGGPRLNMKEMEMDNAEKYLFDLQREKLHADDELQMLLRDKQRGVIPPAVEQRVDTDPMVLNLQGQANYDQQTYQILLRTYGPNFQRVKDAQASAEMSAAKAKDQRAVVEAQELENFIDAAKHKDDSASAEYKAWSENVDRIKSELDSMTDKLAEYYSSEAEERILKQRLDYVQDKVDNMETGMRAQQRRVIWAAPPEVPQNRSFPKPFQVMAVSIAVGLALALGIAFMREMTDTTIRSPRDIARVGQMNLLGMVADEAEDPQASGARLPLVIFDAPHSMVAEQLRQVRTRLQHAVSLDTTRSMMVTSPGPGDGKTTLACNLAAGLALNGRRILLVDANFRRPEVHRIFALANDQGFSDVLSGAVPFDQVVLETQVPNLSVMCAGPKPINATEMFESQLLADFIERALEEYDHVIFDSGPLLVVSESVAMAPRVDGVISVVRARENSRGLLTRMRDGLRQIKAEHLGIVLNAVRAQGGGYYRSTMQTYYDYNT